MIRSINIIRTYFSRSRRRRQIHFDPKLKDISKIQSIQHQIDIHRNNFQSYIPNKTLSETLNDPKPKLDKRFMVDTKQINQKLRTKIKRQLQMQRLIPGDDDEQVLDAISANQQKSFIFNQQEEIQFQQKFKKEIFKKKQVNRLIQKQKNDYKNYLQYPKDLKYLEYQLNKNKLKNNRIQSMMNFQKNNEQLRLLIDSGYIDHPQNIMQIMNQSKSNEEKHKFIQGQNQFRTYNSLQGQAKNIQSQLIISQSSNKNHQTTFHEDLMKNIQGPEQLRDKDKLASFFEKYNQSSQLQKQRTKKDLDLLHLIKQYEQQKFISRYEDINFRFKGQVDFSFMKEEELLSYIKTQKSEKVFPQNLIKIYIQNKQSTNKFRLPIITPTVMGRIYSSCSLFQFPQNLQNNRINMLVDNSFIDLQRNLFKNLQKLSNQSFSDSVFAYSKNHKEEQGILRSKMHLKIVQKIKTQLQQRIFLLQQQDLGLILRSLTKLNIFLNQQTDWTIITNGLSQRLSQMQQSYQYESAIQFITLLPVSSTSIQIISNNIQKFMKYKWEAKQTLLSFFRGSAFMIRYNNLMPQYYRIRKLQQLKHVLYVKQKQIKQILPQISINNYSQVLSVLCQLSACKPKMAEYEINIPQIIINVSKKQITDNIKQQKQLIHKPTIGNIAMSLSLLDYQRALTKNQQLSYQSIPILQISALKSLFPFRPFTYNSSLYFTYHDLLKLTNSQIANLPVKSIVQTLFGCSLVRFKNEGVFDSIVQKLIEKLNIESKDYDKQQIVHQKYVKQYLMLINSFHHSKRLSEDYFYFINLIFEYGFKKINTATPHTIIRFFQSVISLSFTNLKQTEDYKVIQKLLPCFQLVLKHNIISLFDTFLKEQLLCIKYIISFLKAFNTQLKKNHSLFNESLRKIQQKLSGFQLSLQERYLVSLINQMDQTLKQKEKKTNFDQNFAQIEKQYYQKIINQLQEQQQHIGTQFSYSVVNKKLRNKLLAQKVQITQLPWRIELPKQKTVYFLATYQHLAAKYQNKKVGVRLFGIWKIYSQIYNLKGWKFNLICTFLQG